MMSNDGRSTAESLKLFVTPDETLLDYFARCSTEALLTSVPFLDSVPLFPRNKLEIFGPPGSAKTEILLQVLNIK